MADARQAAFDVLQRIFRDGGYSNLSLDAALDGIAIDSREKALATRLVYGTVERRLSLDYIIRQALEKPDSRVKPALMTLLRLGAYQIYFMDRIPDSAAINETVGLAKHSGLGASAGFLNAVLRRIASQRVDVDKHPEASIRYSCPEPLIRMWQSAYGADCTSGILAHLNRPAPLTIRCNTLKITPDVLKSSLESSGVRVLDTPLREAFYLEQAGSIRDMPQYRDGLFHVQDLASQLCAGAVGAKPGERIFDLCAAPGGKAFTMAQSALDQAEIHAFDLHSHRLDLIAQGSSRLGISSIQTAQNDASIWKEHLGQADKVLCDCVCSGLGIIRRKPEIRYKDLDSLKPLYPIQAQMLQTAARYTKQGSVLIYATCALNRRENDRVVDGFLANHPEFRAVTPVPGWESAMPDSPHLTLMPHLHGTDGFFIAKLERMR